MGITISDDHWARILDRVHSSSICAGHGRLQCKVLHKAHFTNARLAKIFPNRSDACERCRQSPAGHVRMFWTCPQLTSFWSNIFDTLNQVLNCNLGPNPLTALFGITPDLCLPATSQCVIAFTTLLARRAILLKWKQASPDDRWIQDVLLCIEIFPEGFLEILSQDLGSYA